MRILSFFGFVLLALALSACGVNLSGEPEIVSESEIQSVPTRQPTQISTATMTGEPASPVPTEAVTSTPTGVVTSEATAAPSVSTPPDMSGSPTAIGATGTLTVRGQLIQGTEGAEAIPAGMPIELYALDVHGQIVNTYEGATGDNGVFVFENVARGIGHTYFVRVDYAGLPQGTQIPAIEGDETELNTTVTLYDRTTDTSTVAITRAQMLINFAPINEFGLEVRLDLELINTGDKIVASDKMSERGWPVSVAVELPVGAFGIQPLQSENSQRYQVELVESVPVVEDTWPLRPEQTHLITILYYLPYENEAVLDQAFGYPVMNASVLVPNDTVTFESDQFETEGEFRYRVMAGGLRVEELSPGEDISPDTDNSLILAYDLLDPLPADARVLFTLKGRPTRTVNLMPPTPQAAQTTGDTPSPLPYVLAGAGGAILVMALVLWWRQRGTAPAPPPVEPEPEIEQEKESLLRAIAELDEAYEAGRVDDETYRRERRALKARLLPLMEDED